MEHRDKTAETGETVEQEQNAPDAEPKDQQEDEDDDTVIRDSQQGVGGQAE